MGLNNVLFAVRLASCNRSELEVRLARLVALYAPLGASVETVEYFRSLSLVVGRVVFSAMPGSGAELTVRDAEGLMMSWGGPVPAALTAPGAVLDAPPARLRELDRTVALVAAAANRAVIACPASGPSTLYEASGPQATAWASHALAAAVLGYGDARIDWASVPEVVATGAVGGTDSQVIGVRATPSAWQATITPAGVRHGSYWPAEDRWQLVPESDALEVAADALLTTLDRRLEVVSLPHCALTAGLDSRVIAAALRELGPFGAFTLGEETWPDLQGARMVAGSLGAPHALYSPQPVTEEEGRLLIVAGALWSDGLNPIHGLARAPEFPEAVQAIVTGTGGEVGRAWYYRWLASNYRKPRRSHLLRVLRHHHQQIAGAARGAHQELDRRLSLRLDDAAESGHSGWRLLDVLYEENRVRRFGRARLARSGSYFMAGFSSPPVNQALASLPLDARLTDGFHRAFLAKFAPDLAPDPCTLPQRRGVPRPLRRLAHRIRSARPVPAQPWFFAGRRPAAPRTRDWVADAVLWHPGIRDVMGDEWSAATRRGFLDGEAHASSVALQLAGLVAIDELLAASRQVRGLEPAPGTTSD